MQRICDAIEAVLANARPASTATNIAVLGSPGMGKSLLVSQALLRMQKQCADRQREVYFLKLRGRGAASVEEDALVVARSLGSRIGVTADTSPSDALRLFKDYLSRLRFVAVIDDANVEGLQAAARLIPVSSALHAVLVTSQQKEEELTPIEGTLGRFEKIALHGFEESTSVELMRKRCPAMCSQELRLKDVAGRLDHLPLGVRLFCEWSQARYCHDVKPMDAAKKDFMSAAKSAAKACGAAFDEHSATATFLLQYLAQPGACDEAAIVQRIFDDWTSNAEVSDTVLLQSNDQHPRGLLGTVRLMLHELDRLDGEDAKGSRQLLSILVLCPPINTPWSLFLGHDGQGISDLEHVTHREHLERIARLLQRIGLVQVQGQGFSMNKLLQRAVRREVAGGADLASRLIDGRVRGEDLKASEMYREILPAAYHVVKEIGWFKTARSEWCMKARQRIAALMSWLGGGCLEVEIRRALSKQLKKQFDILSNADSYDPEEGTVQICKRQSRLFDALIREFDDKKAAMLQIQLEHPSVDVLMKYKQKMDHMVDPLLHEHSFAHWKLDEIVHDYNKRYWTDAAILPSFEDISKLVTPYGNSRIHVDGPAYKEDPEVCRILSEIKLNVEEIKKLEQELQEWPSKKRELERDLKHKKSILNGLNDALKKAETAITKTMCAKWLQPLRDFKKKLAVKSVAHQELILKPPSKPSSSSDCESEVVAVVDGAVSHTDSFIFEHPIPYHSMSASDLATVISRIGDAYQCYKGEFTSNDFDGRMLHQYAGGPEAQLFRALSDMNVCKELHRRRIYAELAKLWAPLESSPLLALSFCCCLFAVLIMIHPHFEFFRP
jgi:hypothetical protein